MKPKAVVLFSGGQDSTTCLAWAIDNWGRENVFPVSFTYGQKHIVELEQAKKICSIFECEQPALIPVEALSEFGAAALTNQDIEVEAVAQEGDGETNWWAFEHNLPSTFVPGRNLLFFTLAAAWGAPRGILDLVTGVCEADSAGYPDCRESFVAAAEGAISEALDDLFDIHAPLLRLNKAKTFKLAEDLGVLDTVIEHSHTCYNGNREDMHEWGAGCGECPACLERAGGFSVYKKEYASV